MKFGRLRLTGVSPGHTCPQSSFRPVVAPSASGIVPALSTSRIGATLRVLSAPVRPALLPLRRPLPALPVRETGRVGVLVDAPALVLTPDAFLLRAVRAGRVVRTYFLTLAGVRHRRLDVRGVRMHRMSGHALVLFETPPAERFRRAGGARVELFADRRVIHGTVLHCGGDGLGAVLALGVVGTGGAAPHAVAGRLYAAHAVVHLAALVRVLDDVLLN